MAKKFYSGDYAGMDSRRAMEDRDFNMIREDKSACANLPQEVKYHAWPKAGSYANYGVGDTITSIDNQMDEDGSKMRKHLQPDKY